MLEEVLISLQLKAVIQEILILQLGLLYHLAVKELILVHLVLVVVTLPLLEVHPRLDWVVILP